MGGEVQSRNISGATTDGRAVTVLGANVGIFDLPCLAYATGRNCPSPSKASTARLPPPPPESPHRRRLHLPRARRHPRARACAQYNSLPPPPLDEQYPHPPPPPPTTTITYPLTYPQHGCQRTAGLRPCAGGAQHYGVRGGSRTEGAGTSVFGAVPEVGTWVCVAARAHEADLRHRKRPGRRHWPCSNLTL